MNKFPHVWLTDTHLKIFGRYKMLNSILNHNPYAVFLTGDISEGFSFLSDLEFLGSKIGRPLYFIHGNHELWGNSFRKTQSGIRKACAKYRNLVWMTDAGIIQLNEKTALIGTEGWYDCRVGNSEYIKYTFDWFMIKELRELSNMKLRILKMQELAQESAEMMAERLEEALHSYNTVYMLTHFPCWPEAHRAHGWISDEFYKPYNTNMILGQKIESVMQKHKNKHLIVLTGHTHVPTTIRVSPFIECRVGKGSYNKISQEEILFI